MEQSVIAENHNGQTTTSNVVVTIQPTISRGGTTQHTYQPKVAYIMSRFPKITETFILYEMLALEQQRVQIEVYPFLRERTSVMHPDAVPFMKRANFHPFISWPILRAHLHFIQRKPGVYLKTLWTLLRANWGSFRFLTGALGIFPKTVYFAHKMVTEEVTHVHAHFASHPAAGAFVIHRLTGIPYSFTAHGSDLHRDQHMLCEKVSEAAFVVAISNYNRDMIISECNGQFQHKVIVIHCGVDTDIFQPHSEQSSYKEDTELFTVLCTGTLHEVKGQKYLIEACRLLREEGIDVVCHFVGDGPDFEDLTKQVRQANLEDRIHFHGRLTREEIATLLRQVDVVATPSIPTSNGRREGIPVVLMEAMSSGVPVVASRISGIPELVINEQSGLLCSPGDARALAEALRRLSDDSNLRQRLGLAGRDKVIREFDLNKNSALLVQYFLSEI